MLQMFSTYSRELVDEDSVLRGGYLGTKTIMIIYAKYV